MKESIKHAIKSRKTDVLIKLDKSLDEFEREVSLEKLAQKAFMHIAKFIMEQGPNLQVLMISDKIRRMIEISEVLTQSGIGLKNFLNL